MLTSEWQKSSFSSGGDNCVEAHLTEGGDVEVRNSRSPEAGSVTFTTGEWRAFTQGVAKGELTV